MSEQAGQKFYVSVDDTEHEWGRSSITVAEIRALGNIPADQQIVEEMADGTERTLSPAETVQLKPGHRYGRAPRYKRGS